eukprot:3380436-Rhodomonas_salina.1
MYADLLPLWRKQQTPTSCGACCALLVHNFLAPASSTSASASASASASGPLAVSAPLAVYTADMAATALRWTEKDVMEHCPTLVRALPLSRVDRDTPGRPCPSSRSLSLSCWVDALSC